jgi:hypothetical protein
MMAGNGEVFLSLSLSLYLSIRMLPLILFSCLLLFDQVPFFWVLLNQSQDFDLLHSKFEEDDV